MITIITIFVAIILTIVIAMSITIIIAIIITIIAAIITMLVQEPGHACHLYIYIYIYIYIWHVLVCSLFHRGYLGGSLAARIGTL